ncbi:MAG: monovalent cation/H(+) antiporter subunit G [Sphingomonadaceae bacterium]
MKLAAEVLALILIAVGLLFYAAGTLGLLRFPDVHARLHALTKADNLGLGFLACGVGLLFGDGWAAARLLLIWLLTLLSAATVAQLVARAAKEPGE